MVYLKDNLPGRNDGNYSRLFGDNDIGSLISAIHGTSIAFGNALEKILPEISVIINDDMVEAFVNKTLPSGVYIIPKTVIVKNKYLKFGEEPDLLLVNVDRNTCRIMEIKIGDNFDTKKARGETDHLLSYADTLKRATTYNVHIGVCMWYAKDKQAVVKGFKNKITVEQAFTGLDFCKMAHLNFEDVERKIILHQEENRKLFFKMVFDIYKKYNYFDK